MALVIEHKGEQIHFDEYNEKWRWNGKDYDKPSNAKTAIDRMLRVDFQRLSAFHNGYRGIRLVTVTSLASPGEVWMVDEEGKRSKEMLRYFYADNETNRALLEKAAEKEKQIDLLRDEISEIHEQMEPLVILK